MNILPILLLVASGATPRVAVVDTQHTRLSRIIQSTITDELRTRSVDVGDPGDFVVEIIDVSDASRDGRTTWVQKDMTHAVQVTEVLGGAAAEVRLYDGAKKLVETWKLTGSGSSSAAVGSRKGNPLSAFMAAPLLRRSRSAEAARAIGHDIAASVAELVKSPASGTPQR
jgi:hypothetical protein